MTPCTQAGCCNAAWEAIRSAIPGGPDREWTLPEAISALAAERDALLNAIDSINAQLTEHGFDIQFNAHAAEVKADRLRSEVENLLKSACPHPAENPTMHAAWKRATRTMTDLGHPVAINYLKRAGEPD